MFKYSIIILITAQILMTPFSTAELYMWKDEKGIKHLSNVPPPDHVERLQEEKEMPVDLTVDIKKPATPEAETKKPPPPPPKIDKPKIDHKARIAERRKKAREAWVKAYGEVTGSFQPGLSIKEIGYFGVTKRRITLSDGSVWDTGRRGFEGALAWKSGTKVTLNRKDGIMYSNNNPDLWVKVYSK